LGNKRKLDIFGLMNNTKSTEEDKDKIAYLAHVNPTEKYRLAEYPYGKNTRGKKRWLLEMKRLHGEVKA
jgi:hypothetical protein